MDDYEAKREAERKKSAEILAKFYDVCRILGFKPGPKDKDRETWDCRLDCVDKDTGRAFSLHTSEYMKWRISIYGDYPLGPKNEHVTVYEKGPSDNTMGWRWDEVKEDRPTISSDKTAEQIAKDIERRFMPSYIKRLELVRSKIAEMIEYNDKTTANLAFAIGRKPTKEEADRREYSFYHDSGHLGEVKAGEDHIDISVSDLTPEQARRIIGIIREVKRKR